MLGLARYLTAFLGFSSGRRPGESFCLSSDSLGG